MQVRGAVQDWAASSVTEWPMTHETIELLQSAEERIRALGGYL
jgi:hypothetical protein